jgi:hypothetical protein
MRKPLVLNDIRAIRLVLLPVPVHCRVRLF